jgi:hypothetical protein
VQIKIIRGGGKMAKDAPGKMAKDAPPPHAPRPEKIRDWVPIHLQIHQSSEGLEVLLVWATVDVPRRTHPTEHPKLPEAYHGAEG